MRRLHKQLLLATAAVTHLLLHNASGTAQAPAEQPPARGHGFPGTTGLAAMTQGTASSPQPRATSSARTTPRGFLCPGRRCRLSSRFSPVCHPSRFPAGNLPAPSQAQAGGAPAARSKDTAPTMLRDSLNPDTLHKPTVTQDRAEAFAAVFTLPCGPFPSQRSPSLVGGDASPVLPAHAPALVL